MRVVVTGATGNVGTSLIEALEADPGVSSVVGIARRRPDWHPTKVTWISADVVDADLVSIFRGADAVVHLAWLFQPTHDPVVTWRNNVRGSLAVFHATAAAGVPTLVHASSVGTYRESGGSEPVDESWPTDALPTAAYGREKSYVEAALDAFELRNPTTRVVRLRPAFIFKRQSAREQRRLFAGPFLPGSLFRGNRLPVVPFPTGLRFQAVHTADAAEAYRLALHRPVAGAFNVAAEPVIDGRELADVLGAPVIEVPLGVVRSAVAVGWHARLLPASPQLVDLFASLPLLDCRRAHDELGWMPRHRATEALGELVDGLAHEVAGPTPPLAAGRSRP